MSADFRIHYTLPDGTEDSVVVSGETIAEIATMVRDEIAKRDATSTSEELP